MTEIDLDKKEVESYGKWSNRMSVTKEQYPNSNFFFKVTHTKEKPDKSGGTYLTFKSSNPGLKASNYYFTDATSFKNVEVFFSSLSTEPLVLGINTDSSRYHRFSNLKSRNGRINLTDDWFPHNELSEKLIGEINELNSFVIYRLDRTGSYNNIKINKYNDPVNGIESYSHTPENETQGKKSLLLYKFNQIKLERDVYYELSDKLSSLQEKKFSSIRVFFTNKQDYNINKEIPFILDLSNTEGNYFLRRIDSEGIRWVQIEKPKQTLDSSKVKEILDEINYDNGRSIMVQLDSKSPYNIKTVENHKEGSLESQTDPAKKVEVNEKFFSGSSYRYFQHDFGQSPTLIGLSILGLKTYVGNQEIDLYNIENKKKNLLFKPKEDGSKRVYVYFYKSDTVPLMITFDSRSYKSTKDSYFTRWKEIGELKSFDPTDSITHNQITKHLEKIDKDFNEIDISYTQNDGYGIRKNNESVEGSNAYYNNETFDGKRVKVNSTEPSRLYGKVTHVTVNGSSIGKVVYNSLEITDNHGLNLSETRELRLSSYTNVMAYYHRTDERFVRPLLLGFHTSNIGIPKLLFQRLDKGDPPIKWEKINYVESNSFQNDGSLLSYKINELHYQFNKSVIIRIENQDESGYQLKTVENKLGTSSPQQVGSDLISVYKEENCLSGSNYMCFKHRIPSLQGKVKLHEVGGLKLYISNKEISINCTNESEYRHIPVYYEQNKNEIHVYFFKGSGSINHSDTVPLLVSYNDKCYSPSSRDEYFDKWVVESITSSSDINGQLTSKLNEINKELNRIDISKTDGNYGLNPPKENQIKNFNTDRVSATQEQSPGNYRKVTHTTVNSGYIGDIYLSGQKIETINTNNSEGTYNKVCVYYLGSDDKYSDPLLICLGSNTSDSCTKRYRRNGLKLTDWKEDADSEFGHEQISQKLETIKGSLSDSIYINIDKQTSYEISFKSEKSLKSQRNNTISVFYGDSFATSYKATYYRQFRHKLSEYYSQNKDVITSMLGLGDDSELTLQIKIKLGSQDIELVSNDGNKLSTPLTYESSHSEELYVYFYDNTSNNIDDSVDKVPLMFRYKNQFYGPESKEKYFDKWKQSIIDLSNNQNENIKKQLDDINFVLNEIEINKIANYGLSDESNISGFDTTRINVKCEDKDNYKRAIHTAKNKFRIGDLKEIDDFKFDNGHNKFAASTVNELIVYFFNDDDTPKLVLACESGTGGRTYVHGYYDLRNELEENVYKFTKSEHVGVLQDLENHVESYVDTTLSDIFKNLCTKPQERGDRIPQVPGVSVQAETPSQNSGSTFLNHDHTQTISGPGSPAPPQGPPLPGSDANDINNVGNQIKEIFKKPEAIGGSGGVVGGAAVAGTGYAIFKYNVAIASFFKGLF